MQGRLNQEAILQKGNAYSWCFFSLVFPSLPLLWAVSTFYIKPNSHLFCVSWITVPRKQNKANPKWCFSSHVLRFWPLLSWQPWFQTICHLCLSKTTVLLPTKVRPSIMKKVCKTSPMVSAVLLSSNTATFWLSAQSMYIFSFACFVFRAVSIAVSKFWSPSYLNFHNTRARVCTTAPCIHAALAQSRAFR